MTAATLTIDLDALIANWRALDGKSGSAVETAAVVKADAYGLNALRVSRALYHAGVRSFFVAVASEGAAIRQALGADADIYVFSGFMAGDAQALRDHNLIPLINSPAQFRRLLAELPGQGFGLQLNTGMNRLGMEATDFATHKNDILARGPKLVISHLACADQPGHAQNRAQLDTFKAMTDGLNLRRSLAATGGILLGSEYHFDLCRPGVGLYGGLPFAEAAPVVRLSIPVVQTREVDTGAAVGYSQGFVARRPTRIATLAAGYADGLIRAMGGAKARVYWHDTPCPVVGRVSMDLLTVDITDLDQEPEYLEILNQRQTVDMLAQAAGTIGYEILTSLGERYIRHYVGQN